jgi:hypothetical protein
MHLHQTIPLIWKIALQALYPFTAIQRVGDQATSVIAELAERDIFTAAGVPKSALLFSKTDRLSTSGLAI